MIGSLYKNDKNRKRSRKNQEIGQISWYLIESRECEEEEGIKNETCDRWCCQFPRQAILEDSWGSEMKSSVSSMLNLRCLRDININYPVESLLYFPEAQEIRSA